MLSSSFSFPSFLQLFCSSSRLFSSHLFFSFLFSSHLISSPFFSHSLTHPINIAPSDLIEQEAQTLNFCVCEHHENIKRAESAEKMKFVDRSIYYPSPSEGNPQVRLRLVFVSRHFQRKGW